MNFTLKHFIIVFLLVFIKKIYANENFKYNFVLYENKDSQNFKDTIKLLDLLDFKDTSITLYSNKNYCILFDKDKMQYIIKSKQSISELRRKNDCSDINNNPFLVFDDYYGKNFFEKFSSSESNQHQGDKYKEILLKDKLLPCSVGFFLNYKDTLKEFLKIFENPNDYYHSEKIITSLNKIKKLLSDLHNIGTINLQFSTLIIKLLKQRLTELITEMFSCDKTKYKEIIEKINIDIQNYHGEYMTSHFINILNYEELRELIKTMFENNKTTRAKLIFNLDENYILASKYLDNIGAKDSTEDAKYKIFRDNFNSAINEKLNDLELNYHKKDISEDDIKTIKENIIKIINECYIKQKYNNKSLPNILLEEDEIGEININIDNDNHEAKVIIENIMIDKNSKYYKSFCNIKSQFNTIDSETKNIISTINNIILNENILERIETYTEYKTLINNICKKLKQFYNTINDLYPKSGKYNKEKSYKVFLNCERNKIDKLFHNINATNNLLVSFKNFVYFFDGLIKRSNENYIKLKQIIERGLTSFIHPKEVNYKSVENLKKTLKNIPLNFYFFSCGDSFIILNQGGEIKEIFKNYGEKKSKEDAKKIISENLENYFNEKICDKEEYIRINTQNIDKYKDSLINSYEEYINKYSGDENTKIFKLYPDYIIDNCKKSFIELILKDLKEIITKKLLEKIKNQLNNENKIKNGSDSDDESDSDSDEFNDEKKLDVDTKKLFKEILDQIENKEKNNIKENNKDKKKIKPKEETKEEDKKENKEKNNIKENNKDKKKIKPKEENKKENKEKISKFLNKDKKLNTSIVKKNHTKENPPKKGNKEKKITQISQNQTKNCNCCCCGKHNN